MLVFGSAGGAGGAGGGGGGGGGCLRCNFSDQPSAQRHKAGTGSELQLQRWHLFICNTYSSMLT